MNGQRGEVYHTPPENATAKRRTRETRRKRPRPVSGSTVENIGKPRRRIPATVRPCAACQSIRRPFDRAGSVPPDSGEHRNAAQPFDRVPPVSLSGKPWRPSASRHHRQAVRPVSDSGGQGFRNRSTVRRVPLPMIPATVCRAGFAAPVSGSEVATIGTPRRIRHHRTRQPLAGSSPRLSAGNRSTVCRLSAIPATVRRHHRTRATYPATVCRVPLPMIPATVRPWRPCAAVRFR